LGGNSFLGRGPGAGRAGTAACRKALCAGAPCGAAPRARRHPAATLNAVDRLAPAPRPPAPQEHGGDPIIPFSGAFENEWVELGDDAEAQKKYAAEHVSQWGGAGSSRGREVSGGGAVGDDAEAQKKCTAEHVSQGGGREVCGGGKLAGRAVGDDAEAQKKCTAEHVSSCVGGGGREVHGWSFRDWWRDARAPRRGGARS
jgi:hypothetical protein